MKAHAYTTTDTVYQNTKRKKGAFLQHSKKKLPENYQINTAAINNNSTRAKDEYNKKQYMILGRLIEKFNGELITEPLTGADNEFLHSF